MVIPERLGNRRLDGFENILKNPHIGFLFLVPGRNESLRVNGKAMLVNRSVAAEYHVVGVARFRPWPPPSRSRRSFSNVEKRSSAPACGSQRNGAMFRTSPRSARILIDQTQMQKATDTTAEELDSTIEEAYQTKLY